MIGGDQMDFSDLQLKDRELWAQYRKLYSQGKISEAFALLENSQLDKKVMLAEKLNAITTILTTIQGYSDPDYGENKIQVAPVPPVLSEGEVYFQELATNICAVVGTGVSCTATNGDTVISTTGGSDGLAMFPISEFGTWTLNSGTEFKVVEVSSTGNYYVSFQTLAQMSWDSVGVLSRAGVAANFFNVGDTKSIHIMCNDPAYPKLAEFAGDYQCTIIDFDHDGLSYDTTKKAGITWQLNSIGALSPYNTENTTVGAWKDSYMRTALMPVIYNGIDKAMRRNILPVAKTSLSTGGQSTETVVTEDKLFLISAQEASGSAATYSASPLEGTQYKYYVDGGSLLKDYQGAAWSWWFRSARTTDKINEVFVYTTGKINATLTTSTVVGISFAFCT